MKFHLNNTEIEFLKKYAEDAFSLIKFNLDDSSTFELFNYDDFITELTFAVLENGMDDEDTVNKIGKQLYLITDKIVEQYHS